MVRRSRASNKRPRKILTEKLKQIIPRQMFEVPQEAFMAILKVDE